MLLPMMRSDSYLTEKRVQRIISQPHIMVKNCTPLWWRIVVIILQIISIGIAHTPAYCDEKDVMNNHLAAREITKSSGIFLLQTLVAKCYEIFNCMTNTGLLSVQPPVNMFQRNLDPKLLLLLKRKNSSMMSETHAYCIWPLCVGSDSGVIWYLSTG